MKDIKLFGHQVKPLTAGAIGVGSAAVIWFAWKQHKDASGSSSSASAIDPLTGLPTSEDNTIDPLTGQTYLSEAQQYGSVQAAESAIEANGGGLGDLQGDGGAYGYSGTQPGGATVVEGTTYGSNAAWAQAVEAGLTDIGYSSTDVSAALGRYLSNLTETTAQAAIVEAAIAEYGPPPVGSYTIKLASSPTPPTTGAGDVEVPDVIGDSVEQASVTLTSLGFKVSAPKGVKGVVHIVTAQSPKAKAKAAMGSTVTLTAKNQGGAKTPAKTAQVTVPDVVGKSQAEAYSVLSADGFHPAGQAPVTGYTLTVSAQNPKAGAKADKGATVTLTSTRKKD